jgi:hypothetical protein
MTPTAVASVIRARRLLGRRHSGDVSCGYDLALDSLAIDLSLTIVDPAEREAFLEACDPGEPV